MFLVVFMIGPHKVRMELERFKNKFTRDPSEALRVRHLEEQVKSLAVAVQPLLSSPAPLIASQQLSLDVAPIPPQRDSLLQASLKRSLSNEKLVVEKIKKKRRNGRRKTSSPQIQRDIQVLEASIAQRADAALESSIMRQLNEPSCMERERQEREWHDKRFADLSKNLNLKGNLEGIS